MIEGLICGIFQGPGGSGVNFVVQHADELQTIVGTNHVSLHKSVFCMHN